MLRACLPRAASVIDCNMIDTRSWCASNQQAIMTSRNESTSIKSPITPITDRSAGNQRLDDERGSNFNTIEHALAATYSKVNGSKRQALQDRRTSVPSKHTYSAMLQTQLEILANAQVSGYQAASNRAMIQDTMNTTLLDCRERSEQYFNITCNSSRTFWQRSWRALSCCACNTNTPFLNQPNISSSCCNSLQYHACAS